MKCSAVKVKTIYDSNVSKSDQLTLCRLISASAKKTTKNSLQTTSYEIAINSKHLCIKCLMP